MRHQLNGGNGSAVLQSRRKEEETAAVVAANTDYAQSLYAVPQYVKRLIGLVFQTRENFIALAYSSSDRRKRGRTRR